MSSLIGRQLGDYTLVSVLATGGMARIYEAVDRRLGRQAAVKVLELNPEGTPEDELLPMRFQREARAVAQLEHDNIITIYQYGEQDGLYFIAMKLIRGRDLAQELARLRRAGQKMDVQRGLRILEQVAAALDCAHAAQIVHRDVKPSNILLDASDRATLTDFGLMIQRSFDATLGTAFGTPRYVAPEQALNSSNAVPQSDTYALGVILYEILTGRPPFDGATPMEIALSQIHDPPIPPRSLNPMIPEAAEREVLRALEKDPARRPVTATGLIDAVKYAYGLLDGSKTELAIQTIILPENLLPAPLAKPRRLPLIRMLLVAGAALIVVVVLLAASRSPVHDVLLVPTVSAASTPAAGARIAVVTEQVTPSLLLTYNDSVFSLTNVSGNDLDMRNLQFARGSTIFAGSSIPRGSLPAGTCFRVQLERVQSALPDQCGRLYSQIVLPDAQRFFWRGDADGSASFELRDGSRVIATCATIPRGGSGQCSVVVAPA